MTTTRGIVRAASIALVLVSGCAVPEYFSMSYWQTDSTGQTSGIGVTRSGGSTAVTLAGNPDVLAQRFRNALSQLGMQAQISSDVDGVRISAMTRSGKQLTVALKQGAQTGGGVQTEVQMQWSGGADTQVESDLLRLVVGAGGR